MTYLKVHNLVHTEEKPYKCDQCEMAIRVKGTLVQHYRRHTNERPYQCDVCNKTFSLRTGLQSHYQIHTGINHANVPVTQQSG